MVRFHHASQLTINNLTMVFDTEFLNKLSEQAKVNPRLRHMHDLRNSPEDNTQRFLNALEPGTVLPIHKHPTCNTVIILLRGAIRHFEYDDNGNVTEQADIKQEGGFQPLVMIEADKWHNLECLESGTVIFEHKDAKYDPEKDTVVFNRK